MIADGTKRVLRLLINFWQSAASAERDPKEIAAFDVPSSMLERALASAATTHEDIRKVISVCPGYPNSADQRSVTSRTPSETVARWSSRRARTALFAGILPAVPPGRRGWDGGPEALERETCRGLRASKALRLQERAGAFHVSILDRHDGERHSGKLLHGAAEPEAILVDLDIADALNVPDQKPSAVPVTCASAQVQEQIKVIEAAPRREPLVERRGARLDAQDSAIGAGAVDAVILMREGHEASGVQPGITAGLLACLQARIERAPQAERVRGRNDAFGS